MLVEIRRPGKSPAPSDVKVTLIRPPIVSSKGAMSDPIVPPVGLGYLAGMLVAEGIPVAVIDATIPDDLRQVTVYDSYVLHGLSREETVARVPADTTIIGISCMFSQDWPSHRALLAALRARFPDALIMAGGEHITVAYGRDFDDVTPIRGVILGGGQHELEVAVTVQPA